MPRFDIPPNNNLITTLFVRYDRAYNSFEPYVKGQNGAKKRHIAVCISFVAIAKKLMELQVSALKLLEIIAINVQARANVFNAACC